MKFEGKKDVAALRELYSELLDQAQDLFLEEGGMHGYAGIYIGHALTYLVGAEAINLGSRRDMIDPCLKFLAMAETKIYEEN